MTFTNDIAALDTMLKKGISTFLTSHPTMSSTSAEDLETKVSDAINKLKISFASQADMSAKSSNDLHNMLVKNSLTTIEYCLYGPINARKKDAKKTMEAARASVELKVGNIFKQFSEESETPTKEPVATAAPSVALEDLNKKLAEAEQKNVKLESLNTQLTKVKGELDIANSAIAANDKTIENLHANLDKNKLDLTNNENKIHALEGQLVTAQQQNIAKSATIEALQSDLAAQRSISQMPCDDNKKQAQIESDLALIKKSATSLNKIKHDCADKKIQAKAQSYIDQSRVVDDIGTNKFLICQEGLVKLPYEKKGYFGGTTEKTGCFDPSVFKSAAFTNFVTDNEQCLSGSSSAHIDSDQ